MYYNILLIDHLPSTYHPPTIPTLGGEENALRRTIPIIERIVHVFRFL